jgi:signal peptidase II
MGAIRVGRFSRGLWGIAAVVVFVADQVTKAVVKGSIPEHTTVPLLPHFFNLIHTNNAGAAFGLFSDSPAPWKTVLLIVISGALLATVIAVMWRNRLGRVVDFLDVYYRSYHWPTFNLADSAIVVGAGFLVFQLLFLE